MAARASLTDQTLEKARTWVDELSTLRASFAGAGFGIPTVEVAFIESLRTRAPWEKPVDAYLDEILRESLYLPRGMWDTARRQAIPVEGRSVYLDRLQAAVRTGEFSPLDFSRAFNILDPNYHIYSRLKVDFPDIWKNYLADILRQKAQDAAHFAKKIADFLPPSNSVTAANVLHVIGAIAEDFGLERVRLDAGATPRALLRTKNVSGFSLLLEWEDIHVLKKRGDLPMTFIVQESGSPIRDLSEWKELPFVASLGAIIPGGDFYSWKNNNWESTVLCLLAHGEILSLSCDAGPAA